MTDVSTLAELADRSGIPARTIRFYIARGLLDGPLKAGRGASYTSEHLERLEEIKRLQAEGRVLTEIAQILGGGPPPQIAAPPTSWWQHVIEDDVVVWVRTEVSPWRMRQIRAAIDDMASRLNVKAKENRSNHK
jgi:DNA-binding transcriptional MerR regulator